MIRSNNFNFGISSWSYPWAIGVAKGPQPNKKMSAIELLNKADELKVGLIQLADNLPLENLTQAELTELKIEAESKKINLEVGTKGIEKDHLLKFLDFAKFLESPILRTLPAIFGVRASIEEVEQNIKEVLPQFENAGIKIVLENQEAYKVAEYAELVRKIDSRYFQICLDLANALGAMEGPYYVMEELGKYTANFHFKDVEIVRSKTLMGFKIVGTSAGKGQIPIHWALNHLKKLKIFPSVIIEHWPDWQGDIESTMKLEEKMVKESVSFMKSLSW